MGKKSNPYIGMVLGAAGATALIEGWARRKGDALESNVPTFGLLLALPAVAAARGAVGARRHRDGTGTRPKGWAAWSVTAAVASAAAAAGTRTFTHLVAPPDLSDAGYNYRHFHYAFYNGERPKHVGTSLLDAKVTDVSGDPINLPDLVGDRPLVIEFGSISCPIYANKVDQTNDIAARYADQADFAMMYTREAHPGAVYEPFESDEVKRQRAASAPEVIGESRRIIVDDVPGTVHRHYGAFPNSLIVVGRDGIVSCWAEWTTPELMAREIDRVLANDGNGAGLDQSMITYNFARPGALGTDINAFLRAGIRSLADFALALPRMAGGRAAAKLSPKAQGARVV